MPSLDVRGYIMAALGLLLLAAGVYIFWLRGDVAELRAEKAEAVQAVEDYRHKYASVQAQAEGLEDKVKLREAEVKGLSDQLAAVRDILTAQRKRFEEIVRDLQTATPVDPEDSWKVIDMEASRKAVERMNK